MSAGLHSLLVAELRLQTGSSDAQSAVLAKMLGVLFKRVSGIWG